MDPIHYLIHLIEQGEPPAKAREHVKLRYGLSDEAIDARLREARAAAWDLISKTWRLL